MILSQAKKMYHGLDVKFKPVWSVEDEQEAAKGEINYKGYKQLDKYLKDGFLIEVSNRENQTLTVEMKRHVEPIDFQMTNVYDRISVKDKDKVVSTYDLCSDALYDTNIKYSDVLKDFMERVRTDEKLPNQEKDLYQIVLGTVCKSVQERENYLEGVNKQAKKEKTTGLSKMFRDIFKSKAE